METSIHTVTFLKRAAANPAKTASKTDFSRMDGSDANIGIPNRSELMTGENTAVSNPTFHPYLYAPTSVKKLLLSDKPFYCKIKLGSIPFAGVDP
ncbi:MAG: hypothetical protein K2G02_00590, partial [Phocaeicola sp.]|nr:hypothetical protein [Phocaeicola sp.]